MTAPLTVLRPAELSNIRCEYLAPPDGGASDVLVIAFHGTYRRGSQGNPDGAFLRGQVMAGLATYAPSCLLLDFRDLSYEWGNTLLGVFQDVDQFMNDGEGVPFPVLTVASDRSAPALHSLLGISGPTPIHQLDLDAALVEARRQARIWLDS